MTTPRQNPNTNVNVTLATSPGTTVGTFPCPTCAMSLDLRSSRAHKPYCVCNSCGVHIFFRGKTAIARLQEISRIEIPTSPNVIDTREPAIVFARLERLRAQLSELQDKRPMIFSDSALDNAISAMEREIARVSEVLKTLAQQDQPANSARHSL